MLIAVVAVLVGATTMAVLRGASAKRPGHASPATARLAAQVAFEGLLGTNAAAGQIARGAIGGACRAPAPGTRSRQILQTQMDQAAGMLRSVLDRLNADESMLRALPSASGLVTDLRRATGARLQADTDYASWLHDLQSTGCYSAPTNDIHYLEAQTATAAGDAAEHDLTGTWSRVAAQLGATQRLRS